MVLFVSDRSTVRSDIRDYLIRSARHLGEAAPAANQNKTTFQQVGELYYINATILKALRAVYSNNSALIESRCPVLRYGETLIAEATLY
jgi:hypothetical protein